MAVTFSVCTKVPTTLNDADFSSDDNLFENWFLISDSYSKIIKKLADKFHKGKIKTITLSEFTELH